MNTLKTIKRTFLDILSNANRADLFLQTKLFCVAPINFRHTDFIIKVVVLYACFKERLLIIQFTQQPWLNGAGFFQDIHLWGRGRCRYCCCPLLVE